MKYTLDCDILDGLIFIDESYLSELKDADLLYEMDILLDVSGSSELICDFPNEDWDTVRQRETGGIREFCGQGKMIVWVVECVVKECELIKSAEIQNEGVDNIMYCKKQPPKSIPLNIQEVCQCLWSIYTVCIVQIS